MNKKEEKMAVKVSIWSIIGNILLTILKMFAGFWAHSQAMLSDAIHSASDVFSTIIVIIGVKLSNKKADKNHQYGHERLECVAALILSFTLFVVGLKIGITGLKYVFSSSTNLVTPGILALIAAIISILVKEIMFWYTKAVAKKLNSGALLADAWHHRSDALSSIGSLIGIIGARMGFIKLDSIASIIICFFILKIAYDIFKDSINKMVDKACDQNTIDRIIQIIKKNPDVINIDELKTRLFGNKIYIDLEISVNPDITIFEAHSIAEYLHDQIEKEILEVKHCMIHVNPKV